MKIHEVLEYGYIVARKKLMTEIEAQPPYTREELMTAQPPRVLPPTIAQIGREMEKRLNRILIITRGGIVLAVHATIANQVVEVLDLDDLQESVGKESIQETINKAREGMTEIY